MKKEIFRRRENSVWGIIFSVLSGIAAGISFSFPSIGFLCLIALSPMIYSAIFAKKSRPVLSVFLFSLSYCLTADMWLTNLSEDMTDSMYMKIFLSVIILLGVSLIISVLQTVPFLIFKYLRKNAATDIIVFSFLYILGEWLSGRFYPISFPWNRLCGAVSGITPFIQTASVFGGLFISLLVVIINGLIAAAAHLFIQKKIKPAVIFSIASLSVFAVNTLIGYAMIYTKTPYENTHTAAIIQGNFSGHEKRDASSEEIVERYLSLSASCSDASPELYIFPETSLKSGLFNDKSLIKKLSDFCRENNTEILTGIQFNEEEKHYNVCAMINENGISENMYRKKLLVPFGEYNPIGRKSFVGSDFSPGEEMLLLETAVGKLGCAICFESVFPECLSECSDSGAQAIVVLTNDSWLGEKIPLYQHHSHSIMRAVETGKYVLTCTNTGISSSVDPCGRITARAKINEQAAFTADFALIEKKSVYTIIGDVAVLPAFALVLACIVRMCILIFRKKRD